MPLYRFADHAGLAVVIPSNGAGVPEFTPHDLRHRRVSVLHLRGTPWARIEFLSVRCPSI